MVLDDAIELQLGPNWGLLWLVMHRKSPIDGADDALIEFLVNMSASADVLAMAKVEVDLTSIPEGKNVSGDGID